MVTKKKQTKRAPRRQSKKNNFNNDNMHKHVLFGFQTILVIAVALAVILGFFYAGFYVGYRMGVNNGWEKAGEAIAETGVFEEVEEVFSLSGIVTKVDLEKDKIYFNADQPNDNPLGPQAPTERVAILGENVPIIKIIDKPVDQLEKELAAYEAAIEGGANLDEPNDTVEMVYPLAAISEGDKIRVRSRNDIYWEENFTASEVLVY